MATRHPFALWDTVQPTSGGLTDVHGTIRDIEVRDVQTGQQEGILASRYNAPHTLDTLPMDLFLADKIRTSNANVDFGTAMNLRTRRTKIYMTVDTAEGHPCVLRVERVPLFVSFMVKSHSVFKTNEFAQKIIVPYLRRLTGTEKVDVNTVVRSDLIIVSEGVLMADQHVNDGPMHLVRIGVTSASAREFIERMHKNMPTNINGSMTKTTEGGDHSRDSFTSDGGGGGGGFDGVSVWQMVMRGDRETNVQQVLLQMGEMPLPKWGLLSPEERLKIACGIPGCGTTIRCRKERLKVPAEVVSRFGQEWTTYSLDNIEVCAKADVCAPPTHHLAFDCEMVAALTESEATDNLKWFGTREPLPSASIRTHEIISLSMCHWLESNTSIPHMEFIVLDVGEGGTEEGVESSLTHPTAFAQAEGVRQKTLEMVKMTCEFPTAVRKITFGTLPQMIRAFFRYMANGPIVALHGHNIHRFDLPYLWRYYIAHSGDVDAEKRVLFWAPYIGQETEFKSIQRCEFKAHELLKTHQKASFDYAWRVSPMLILDTMDMDMFMKPKHTVNGMKLENLTKNIFGVGGKMEGMSGAKVTDAYLKGQINDIHAYCVIDTWLSMRANSFLKIYSSICMLAQLANVNPSMIATNPATCKGLLFKGMFSNVALMNNHVAQSKLPKFPYNTEYGYPGGFVVDPKETKMYKNVFTLDFNSLYPSVIIANNLCYSTIIGILDHPVETNGTTTPFNGVPFTEHVVELKEKKVKGKGKGKELLFKVYVYIRKADGPGGKKGVLPIMCEHLIKLRKMFKECKANAEALLNEALAVINDILQNMTKVVTNSIYGLLGSSNESIACKIIAALVTQIGRNSIKDVPIFLCERYKSGSQLFLDLANLLESSKKVPDYVTNSTIELLRDWRQANTHALDDSLLALFVQKDDPTNPITTKLLADILRRVVALLVLEGWKGGIGVEIVAGDTDSVMIRLCRGAFLSPLSESDVNASLVHMDLVGWVCGLIVKSIPGLGHSAMNMEHEDSCLMFVIRKNVKKRYLKLYASPGKHAERTKKIQGFSLKKSDSRSITAKMQSTVANAILSFDNYGGNRVDLQDQLVTVLIHHLANAVHAAGKDCILSFNEDDPNGTEEDLYRSASGWARLFRINSSENSQELFRGDVCPFTFHQVQNGEAKIFAQDDDEKDRGVSGEGQTVAMKRWILQGKPVELGVSEVQSVIMANMHIVLNSTVKSFEFEIPTFTVKAGTVKMSVQKSNPKFWDMALLEQAIGIAEENDLKRPRLDISYMLGMECNGVVDLLVCVLPAEEERIVHFVQELYRTAVHTCATLIRKETPVVVPITDMEAILRGIYINYKAESDRPIAKQKVLDGYFTKAPKEAASTPAKANVQQVAVAATTKVPATSSSSTIPKSRTIPKSTSTSKSSISIVPIPLKSESLPELPAPKKGKMDDDELGIDLHCTRRFNGNYDSLYKKVTSWLARPAKYWHFFTKFCTEDFGTEEKLASDFADIRSALGIDDVKEEEEEEEEDDKYHLEEVAKAKQERREASVAKKRRRLDAFHSRPDSEDEFEFGADLHCRRRFGGCHQSLFEALLTYEMNAKLYWKKHLQVCIEDFENEETFLEQFREVMDDKQHYLQKMNAKVRQEYLLDAFERDQKAAPMDECLDSGEEEQDEEVDEEAEEKAFKKNPVSKFLNDGAVSGADSAESEGELGDLLPHERIAAGELRSNGAGQKLMSRMFAKFDPTYHSDEELDGRSSCSLLKLPARFEAPRQFMPSRRNHSSSREELANNEDSEGDTYTPLKKKKKFIVGSIGTSDMMSSKGLRLPVTLSPRSSVLSPVSPSLETGIKKSVCVAVLGMGNIKESWLMPESDDDY